MYGDNANDYHTISVECKGHALSSQTCDCGVAGKTRSGWGSTPPDSSRQNTAEDARALEKLSDLFEGVNAELLRVAMDNELLQLYERDFLKISHACYQRLQRISSATIDRLRQRYGRGLPPRIKRGHTKSGTLLKSQIRVRTWLNGMKIAPGSPDGSGDACRRRRQWRFRAHAGLHGYQNRLDEMRRPQ